MAIKRVTEGTGITAFERISFTEEDADSPEAKLILQRATINGRFSEIEAECFAILGEAGLPTQAGHFYFTNDGKWSVESLPGCALNGTSLLWKIAQVRGHEPDSAVGYAARLIDDIYFARRWLEAGKYEQAMNASFYVGMKYGLRLTKTNWERAAMSGKKALDGAAKTKKGSMTASERVAEVERLVASGMIKKAAIGVVADREGVSDKAIEKNFWPKK